MIRRKVRTAKQKQALKFKQSAPIGTGESISEKKERLHALEVDQIAKTRAEIWLKRTCCQACRGMRPTGGLPDEMHEWPSRAMTRGLPADQRFNVKVCCRLCHACHADVTEKRMAVVPIVEDLGFEGPIRVEVGPCSDFVADTTPRRF